MEESKNDFGNKERDDALQKFGGLSPEDVAELASIREKNGDFDFFLPALMAKRNGVRPQDLLNRMQESQTNGTPVARYALMGLFARVPFRP